MDNNTLIVKNAEGEPDTQAQIIIQNKIDYTPKVSVIIPVYNTEEYLRECMDSVINQTLKEIEIICVDDGSTDGSLSILKEYAKKDERITVITQENQCAGIARNCGISVAAGEFIAFMDSDDLYPKNETLETMYVKATKNNVLICGGSLNNLVNGALVTEPSLITNSYYYSFMNKDEGKIVYTDYQYDYGYWRFIYKRNFLIKNQIYFPNYKRFEDPPFLVKAMALAKEFYALKEAVYTYRKSHKQVAWTEEKIYHLLSGLKDNLLVAVKYDLDKLYDLTLTRINKEYKAIIAKEKSERTETVKKEILAICLEKARKRWSLSTLNPKVSVIMPCYNTAPYLRQALDSVVNQTLKDIEIICVNDGSTDNTLDIIKEYAARDSRIKYIDKPNAGYGHSMNCGVDLATGEYIGILEPDDYLALDMYETQYKVAKENDLDFVKADFYRFVGEDYTLNRLSKNPEDYNVVCKPIEKLETFLFIMNTWSGIYRREFIQRFDIRHNETPGASFQDNGFFVQTFCFAERAMFLDKPFYMNRRDNPNSSVKSRDKVYCVNEEYRYIKELLLKHNLFDKMKDVYEILKYHNIIFTLSRIDNSFKLQYVFDSAEELRNDLAEYNFSYTFFNRLDKIKIKLLISNPKEFYCKYVSENEMTSSKNHSPLLFKDIGLGCNTWCEPRNVSGNAYTYDLSDNIYTRYVSWDPIKEGSCDVEILRLSAVEKRSKRVVEFPVDKIISSGKISSRRVEFRNQKCWIGCAVEGAYESFTVEAKISNNLEKEILVKSCSNKSDNKDWKMKALKNMLINQNKKMVKKQLNIVYILDSKYFFCTYVSMLSLINSKYENTYLNINIIYSNLTNKEQSLFEELQNSTVSVSLIHGDVSKYQSIQKIYHITNTALLKFDIPNIFPDLDKIIYIDGDTMIQKDLSILFEMNLDNYYIAATREIRAELREYHKIVGCEHYINSGVMVFNLNNMRKNNISKKMVDLKLNQPKEYKCMDQDIFNKICDGKILYLPLDMNCMISIFLKEKYKVDFINNFYNSSFKDLPQMYKNAYILHFAGDIKPWEYNIEINNISTKYINLANNSLVKNISQKIILKSLSEKGIYLTTNYTPFLFKDIGLGCNTWCEPRNVSGNVYTYDLSDNIYTRYVSWDPIKEGSCDVEIVRLSAVEKRSKRVVEFPVDRIISSGKISGRRVEFRNQKCWIGCTVEGAYESFTVEASVSRV